MKSEKKLKKEKRVQDQVRQTFRDRDQNYDIDGVSMDEDGEVVVSGAQHRKRRH